MFRPIHLYIIASLLTISLGVGAQELMTDSAQTVLMATQELLPDSTATALMTDGDSGGVYKILKEKFIEGNPYFMSLVALALIVGLVFCIERFVFLALSDIRVKRFMADLETKIDSGKISEAKEQCSSARGPVAAICRAALERIDEPMDHIERAVQSRGTVEIARLERGCSWISMCISLAPSLGFLGTVIGMVVAFDDISAADNINASIVADGMKMALITTIFGIVVAIILQLLYNWIITKIDRMTAEMEESATVLLDAVVRYKHTKA